MKNLLETFEGWSKTAFIIAAVLIAAFAVVTAAYNITGNPVFQDVGLVVAPATIVFVMIGAFGLHAKLIDETLWLVRVTVVLGLIGFAGGFIATIGNLLGLLGIIASVPSWVEGVMAVIPLGYLAVTLTGIAALRSEHYSQTAGILLLLPGILVFASLATIGLMSNANETLVQWIPPVYDTIFALILAGIGLSLPGTSPQPAKQQTQQPTAA